MTKEVKIKRLSEYNTIQLIKILAKINRAIAPYAKDKKFMKKLRGCFSKADRNDLESSGFDTLMEIIELLTESAPELVLDVLAVLFEADKKDIEEANALDVLDAIVMLREDAKLMDFLSLRFSQVLRRSASI